jgi:D-tyrosyl-tRNA(Tyr) deacylase
MKTVVQRVTRAEVRVDGEVVGRIEHGVLALVGVERGDSETDAEVTARKLASLRMFRGAPGSRPPGAGGMDRTLLDIGGSALVVSQFTLAGSIRKGRRPSFDHAEDPPRAAALYEHVCATLRSEGVPVQTGRFGAMMDVEIVNDGPVTLLVFTKEGVLQ